MTGKEIRDLGFIKWRNDYAWMEPMKGKRWETLIHSEKRHFNTLISRPHIKKQIRQMQTELEDAAQYVELESFKIGCGTIDIFILPTSRFLWKWSWLKKRTPAYDIDVMGNIVWYVTSDEDVNFDNQLICEDTEGKKIWTKSAVSSQIAVVHELCYFIKVVDYFKTVELSICNALTGKAERVIYRENDKECDLILHKASNRSLYLQSSDPVSSRLYSVVGSQLIPLYKNSVMQIPLGLSVYGTHCVLTKDKLVDSRWKAHGKPVSDWILPDAHIEWINMESGHIVTIHDGAQAIWYCSKKKPQTLLKIKAGSIYPNTWCKWENTLIENFIVKSPFEIPFVISIINNKIFRVPVEYSVPRPIAFKPLEVHLHHTPSFDGTRVPYMCVKEGRCKPKALLVYVYGSYGSSTPIDWPYQKWFPLLKRRWLIAFAMVRGSGDVDDAWAEAARRENRHVSIDDFEAVIRAAQRRFGLGPEKTVIYGRSAGGLPVGAIISRFPNGELVGAAFTEAPYVDVLRTSSNPELPLTVGEYKEFGNPASRLVDFKELLSVSPINTLPIQGAPGVFVLCRVGSLDRQVFMYESFKWIQTLRGHSDEGPKEKYITYEENEAHQYKIATFPKFRAIDLAILDSWIDRNLI
jgi:pimeloyl-ACP methyl ester carboxylesterase